MGRVFIEPKREAPAIRRAAVLLERALEDGEERDSGIKLLQDGLGTIQRAAQAGRWIPEKAIDRLEAALDRVSLPPAASDAGRAHDLVRSNALAETRELVTRLSHSSRGRSRVRR